jgi:hypothetical protein
VASGQPPRHFPFVQFEFGFALGPADGRYVTRDEPEGEPERIVVLRTVGAQRRRGVSRRRPRKADGEGGEPLPVPVARAMVIRVKGFESDEAANGWLDALRRDSDALDAEAADAARELNALLRAHRAAAADPHVRDVAAQGATVVRVGFGSGDQVADGRYAEAYELPPAASGSRVRRRAESLAPDERLAGILARREEVLACEELALRARIDLDAGRPREAALQARIALEAAVAELDGAEELAADREVVARAANEALTGEPGPELQEQVADAVGRIETALRRRRLKRI